jgi:hypothetical protein
MRGQERRPLTLSDDDFEYESLDDLRAKMGDVIARLRLDTTSPSVACDFGNFEVKVWYDRDAKIVLTRVSLSAKLNP